MNIITEYEKLEILEEEKRQKELLEIEVINQKAKQSRIIISKAYREIELTC